MSVIEIMWLKEYMNDRDSINKKGESDASKEKKIDNSRVRKYR
jgi:hypothetical protein